MRFTHAVSMIALLAFATPAFADDYVIMKVNNQDVTSSAAKKFWEGLFPAGQAPDFTTQKPEVREKVLRAVMAEKLLYTDALAHGVDKSDSVQKQIEDMRQKLIVRTYLDTKTTDTISDADLKKEYDAVVAANKDERELRARHILVPTEAEAKAARKKIDEGKSFEEVAKELSKDPGSAKQGGDLGWFTREKMVKEFSDAAAQLKKGEVSGPVKSAFGWHIIKLEDSRKIPAPAFADVKEQIRGKLQETKLNDYISSIVKTADVKVFDAKGKEVPFEKNLPAEKPAAKAVEAKPEAKPEVKADAKTDKPAEKPAEKAAEKPADKPAEKAADKPADKADADKPKTDAAR